MFKVFVKRQRHVLVSIFRICLLKGGEYFFKHRSSMGQCNECNSNENCGFCLSSFQCLSGTESGPSNNSPCPDWTFKNSSCPCNISLKYIIVGNFYLIIFSAPSGCNDYVDCYNCANQEACAWCASDNTCTSLSTAFGRDCSGLVFEPPCPANYVPGD
jgi:hypothetical protein